MSLLGFAAGAVTGPGRLYAELLVAGALVTAIGVQSIRISHAETGEARAQVAAQAASAVTADVRRQWAQQAADAASAALTIADRYREISAELQRTKDEADHALQTERASHARTAAALAAEHDGALGLRQQLATYAAGAAGGRGAADDSLAACRDRSQTLGQLLDEGVRVQEAVAGDAESAAADVRALLDAWPRVTRNEPTAMATPAAATNAAVP